MSTQRKVEGEEVCGNLLKRVPSPKSHDRSRFSDFYPMKCRESHEVGTSRTTEIEVYIISQLHEVGGPDARTSFKMTAASWEREEDPHRPLPLLLSCLFRAACLRGESIIADVQRREFLLYLPVSHLWSVLRFFFNHGADDDRRRMEGF